MGLYFLRPATEFNATSAPLICGTATLFSSTRLLAELHGVLNRAKFANALATRGLHSQHLFDGYAAMVQLVAPAQIQSVIALDPADDAVLACALAANAELIVSGDAHLLNLKNYQRIPIVRAAEALARIVQR